MASSKQPPALLAVIPEASGQRSSSLNLAKAEVMKTSPRAQPRRDRHTSLSGFSSVLRADIVDQIVLESLRADLELQSREETESENTILLRDVASRAQLLVVQNEELSTQCRLLQAELDVVRRGLQQAIELNDELKYRAGRLSQRSLNSEALLEEVERSQRDMRDEHSRLREELLEASVDRKRQQSENDALRARVRELELENVRLSQRAWSEAAAAAAECRAHRPECRCRTCASLAARPDAQLDEPRGVRPGRRSARARCEEAAAGPGREAGGERREAREEAAAEGRRGGGGRRDAAAGEGAPEEPEAAASEAPAAEDEGQPSPREVQRSLVSLTEGAEGSRSPAGVLETLGPSLAVRLLRRFSRPVRPPGGAGGPEEAPPREDAAVQTEAPQPPPLPDRLAEPPEEAAPAQEEAPPSPLPTGLGEWRETGGLPLAADVHIGTLLENVVEYAMWLEKALRATPKGAESQRRRAASMLERLRCCTGCAPIAKARETQPAATPAQAAAWQQEARYRARVALANASPEPASPFSSPHF